MNTHISNGILKFILLYGIASILLIALPVKSETCGVCKSSYLSCVSSGQALKSCEKRMRSCEEACFGNSANNESKGGEFGLIPVLIIITLVGGVGYLVFLTMTEKKSPKKVILDRTKSDQLAIQDTLRNEIKDRIRDMTVEEISDYIKATERATIAWLRRQGMACKDFDGVAAEKKYRAGIK
jgi:hypothetical protein